MIVALTLHHRYSLFRYRDITHSQGETRHTPLLPCNMTLTHSHSLFHNIPLYYLQTTVTLQFKPHHPQVSSYTLEWKQHPQPWQQAHSKSIPVPVDNGNDNDNNNDTMIVAEATDLLPATTYCLRIVPMDMDMDMNMDSRVSGGRGEPSPELIVDTEAIGCTPDSKSCCIVQ